MREIKHGIYLLFQACLWLTFLLGINDPGFIGVRPPGNLLNNIGVFLDLLYHVTNAITMPVQKAIEAMGLYHPTAVATDGFPLATAHAFNTWSASVNQGNAWISATLFEGAADWWIPITSVCLVVLSVLFDQYYEGFRNWVWNVLVEYMFHRKKVHVYEQALDQRNADLAQMNNRYTTLAQETHSLKDSVITDECGRQYAKSL